MSKRFKVLLQHISETLKEDRVRVYRAEGGKEIYEKFRDWILSRTVLSDHATYFFRKILVIPQKGLPM